MKISSLHVENFRALKRFDIGDLSDGVVLAGPNGCGKSCVLDALRLLKSAYGSYRQDEWHQWLNEFQIENFQGHRNLTSLFQDRERPILVAAKFQLREGERAFLKEHGLKLLQDFLLGPQHEFNLMLSAGPAHGVVHVQEREEALKQATAALPHFVSLLEQLETEAVVTITPAEEVNAAPNLLLQITFSTYDPQHLGIVDYHGPNRTFGRENLQNINLTIQQAYEDRLRDSALYNYNNKYNNLKTEIASAYIRHLLAKESDPNARRDDSLTENLKELFTTFFPGKQFLGPRPTNDGRLSFPVKVASGHEHDIDDLSSGEKEVLYGYLRLHNAAPRNSVILIDEPELHLNPKLLSGLASFYHKKLAKELNNQLWLVTHSDTVIREAVDDGEYSVFHVHPLTPPPPSKRLLSRDRRKSSI